MTFRGFPAPAIPSAGRTTYVDTPPITSNAPRGVPECAIRGLRKQHSPHGRASVADILTCECGPWPMFQRSDCEGKSGVEEGCGRGSVGRGGLLKVRIGRPLQARSGNAPEREAWDRPTQPYAAAGLSLYVGAPNGCPKKAGAV